MDARDAHGLSVPAAAQTWDQPPEKTSGSMEQQLKALWTPTSQESTPEWATTPWTLAARMSPAETQLTQHRRDQSSPSQLLPHPGSLLPHPRGLIVPCSDSPCAPMATVPRPAAPHSAAGRAPLRNYSPKCRSCERI